MPMANLEPMPCRLASLVPDGHISPRALPVHPGGTGAAVSLSANARPRRPQRFWSPLACGGVQIPRGFLWSRLANRLASGRAAPRRSLAIIQRSKPAADRTMAAGSCSCAWYFHGTPRNGHQHRVLARKLGQDRSSPHAFKGHRVGIVTADYLSAFRGKPAPMRIQGFRSVPEQARVGSCPRALEILANT